MARENIVTIPLEEYFDLRKKAEENIYLATQLGSFEQKLYNLETKVFELEGLMRDGK